MGLSTDVLRALAAGHGSIVLLADHLEVERRVVGKAVQVLKRRGLIGASDAPGRGRYHLTAAGQAWLAAGKPVSPGQGPRPRTHTAGLRERAWWHFRAHRMATLQELLSTHAEGHEKAPDVNLYKYLSALERAGILRRSAQRLPARQSRGRVQWRLVADLGPKAPVWRETARVVFDPNSGATRPLAGAESPAGATP